MQGGLGRDLPGDFPKSRISANSWLVAANGKSPQMCRVWMSRTFRSISSVKMMLDRWALEQSVQKIKRRECLMPKSSRLVLPSQQTAPRFITERFDLARDYPNAGQYIVQCAREVEGSHFQPFSIVPDKIGSSVNFTLSVNQ